MGRFVPVSFQDAEFEHRFAWVNSKLEGIHRRWIPFGMPRLSPAYANMVFFLYGRDPKTGEIAGPCGSGLLVGVPQSGPTLPYIRHAYAVTAKHVSSGGASILRINTKDGKHRFIEFYPDQWKFDPDGDDLSIIDITDRLNRPDDDYSLLPDHLCASKDFFTEFEFGIGEDGFMLGLFADQAGIERNLVAARFGNVSLLASDNDPIEQPNHNTRPSHIFDMHSRPGFSGSPVFVYRTPAGDIRDITYGPPEKPFNLYSTLNISNYSNAVGPLTQMAVRQQQILEDEAIRKNTFIRLLGIQVGEYPDLVEIKRTPRIGAKPHVDDKTVMEGDKLEIPNSMALVVPAWEITRLLDRDDLKDQRKAREMEDLKKKKNVAKPSAVSPASSPAKSAQSTTDDNPQHKEAFTSLVRAAAKTPKQDL